MDRPAVALSGVGETVMVGLLFAVAALVWSLFKLRLDLMHLRGVLASTREDHAALTRRVDALSDAARASETALIGRHLRETFTKFGVVVLPDGTLHDANDETRPTPWQRLVEGETIEADPLHGADGNPSPKTRDEAG